MWFKTMIDISMHLVGFLANMIALSPMLFYHVVERWNSKEMTDVLQGYYINLLWRSVLW